MTFTKHYQEPTQRIEKPPIGVMPIKIHKEHRFYDLCGAITRYYNVNYPIPIEWIEEYNELLTELIK